MPTIPVFALWRQEDVSGVSGTGTVAVGVRFPSGRCVMEWLGNMQTISVYASLDDLMAIHGHEGKTIVQWDCDDSGGDIAISN